METSGVFQAEALEGKDRELYGKLHETLKKVTEDLEALRFNTAIAALMEFLNALYEYRKDRPVTPVYRTAIRYYLQMLFPFAPTSPRSFGTGSGPIASLRRAGPSWTRRPWRRTWWRWPSR